MIMTYDNISGPRGTTYVDTGCLGGTTYCNTSGPLGGGGGALVA